MTVTTEDAFNTDDSTFGGRVAAARKEQGFSQSDLAARLGLTPKTVSGWEAGLSRPRSNKMQMLAAILNVSLRWLMSGSGKGEVNGSVARSTHTETDSVRAILSEMRELKADLTNSANKLNRLEKRLQEAL